MATAPNAFTFVPGPSGAQAQAALVYADANGSLANVTSPWVLGPSGLYLSWPVAADGTPEVELTGSLPELSLAPNGNTSAPWRQASVNNNAQGGEGIGMVTPYLRDFSSAFLVQAVVPATYVASTPYSGLYSLAITTATTTAVKASTGLVGTLSNASGAATGSVTVYDSTTGSGKTLWAGTLAAGQVLPLGIPCGTGITIVTAAADPIAVSYA